MIHNPELRNRLNRLLSLALIQLVWITGIVLPASAITGKTGLEPNRTAHSPNAKSPTVAEVPPPAEAIGVEPLDRERRIGAYGQLPMTFESNRGQADASVKFLSRGSGYGLFLTKKEAVMVLRRLNDTKQAPKTGVQPITTSSTFKMQFIGGNPRPRIQGLDEISTKSNYFLGKDRRHWQTDVSTFSKVRYEEIYPGVNLIYYGNQQQLEYDFVLMPGASIEPIKLRFKGARKITIDSRGDLVLQTNDGEIRQSKPKFYQDKNGVRQDVDGRYVLLGKREVGFQVGAYDRQFPLVIDPVLAYSTYIGGNGGDSSNAVAVDSNGNTYITGNTPSTNFPTVNPLDASFNAGTSDAFVAKMNAAGNALVYSTYLGGSGDDFGSDVALDGLGNCYLTGRTSSTNFPTATPVQPGFGGSTDFFVTKLDATGSSLVFSTYLGGANFEFNPDIAVDPSGNTYVTGQTASTDFPTANAIQAIKGAGVGYDAFITKLDPSGSAYVYSTYLGGNLGDYGTSIVAGPGGEAYIAGYTESVDFPTANALQPAIGGGSDDAFTAKINAAGSALVYSTFLGGTAGEAASGIAVDAVGNIYLAGRTSSTNFPKVNPIQPTYGGGSNDAFVTKLAPNASSIVYSTYVGGNNYDFASDLVIDTSNNVYLTGYTTSPNFPLANPLQAVYGGGAFDAFITKIDSTGSAYAFSTYFGGSANDFGYGIAVDAGGSIYLTGSTASTNFPTANAWQPALSGTSDAFLTKISGLGSSYGITGRITDVNGNGLGSITVNLSGSQTGTTQTNSSGNYNFANLASGGNYTVTPVSITYSFIPASLTFNGLSQNQQADFTASLITYSISGRIADAGGIGLAGVNVALSGSATTATLSDANGNYTFGALAPGGNYTVTPSKSYSIYTYVFAPANQTLNNLSANQTVNFTSTLTSQVSLNAIADAYVRDGASATNNFGSSVWMEVRTDSGVNNGLNRDAYLKFDLSSVSSAITGAKLSIFAALSPSGSVNTSVYPVANTSWIEQGTGSINWNNKPALGTAIAGAVATINNTSYTTYQIDVTSYIQAEKGAGRDLVTLALRYPSPSTTTVTLNSREAAAHKPQLIITTNGSDNLAPNVSLTGPTNGTTFTAPANVVLSANATDADGNISKVDFFAGTALIGTATTPVSGSTYSISWNSVPSGSYLLSAVATDNKGASTTSNVAGITVVAANSPPTASITSPANNANFVAGSNISLAADAADIDGSITKVEFFHGGTNKIGEDLTAPYTLTWNSVAAASYTLTAKATDNTGAITTSGPVNITVTAPPVSGETTFLTGKTLGTLRNNLSNFAGMKITVGAVAISVSQLGRIFVAGNSGTHTIKIVKATDGLDVSGGSVSLAMPGGTGGQFKYARLANPILLQPNTAYYIVSQETSGGDQWYDSNTSVTSTTAAAVSSGIYRNVSTWTVSGTANKSFVPVDFKYYIASAVYHLHKEASSTSGLFQLKTAGPDGTALALRTVELRSQPTGEKLIKEFDTQTGVPNTGGVIPATSTVTFSVWMKKTANQGTMFPRVKVNLNSSSGASLCIVTGTTALTTTLTKYTLTGTTSAPITVGPTDRYYLWTGVNLTVASSAAVFMGELDVEGTLNGNYDSLINAPLPLPPNISSLSPTIGPAGTSLTVNGSSFGATQGTSTLTLNNQLLTVSTWGNASLVVVIPSGASTGLVVVTVKGVPSNGVTFTVGIVDSDGDGLSDAWETQYFGNLAQTAAGDPDGDGKTNLQEYLAGRNPTKAAVADPGGAVNLKINTPLDP